MGKVNSVNRNFMSVRQLSIAGLLVGITIFLGISGYGFIPLFAVNATILHIPTIIGAMAAGPKVGAMTGFFFGMFSFIQAFRSPAVMMQFASSYNPLYTLIICVVPRVAIGWIAWKLFRILPGKLVVRAGGAAVITTFLHTVMFLSLFYLLVGVPFAQHQGVSPVAVAEMLAGIAGANGIPEAIVAGVITAPILSALYRIGNR